jgi:hypothetical protein
VDDLLQNPAVQVGLLPFAVAFVLVVAIRFGGGARLGPRFAMLGPCVALVAAYWVLEGQPPFPPVGSMQKLPYLIVLAIGAGVALDAAGAGRTTVKGVAALFTAATVLWLAQRKLLAGPDIAFILRLLVLWVAGVVTLWLLEHAAQTATLRGENAEAKGGLNAPALLMVAAFATAAVSLFGGFSGMALLTVAIGAALGAFVLVGYLLFVFSGRTLAFGAMGVIGLGGAWISGIYVAALFGGDVDKVALAVLAAVFVADLFARRVRLGDGAGARITEPLLYGIIIILPAAVAAGLAFASYNSDPG